MRKALPTNTSPIRTSEGRKSKPPAKVAEEPVRINGRIGLVITTVVGTMWFAYLFTLLALISLPLAIKSGQTIVIIS